MSAARHHRQNNGRRIRVGIPRTLLALPLVVAGMVLLILATASEAHLVGQEVFQGASPPGFTLVPVNQTGYGAASFSAPQLPCPLLIYPLTPLDFIHYQEDLELPTRSLNCEQPNGSTRGPINHFLLRNVDPADSMNYTVEVRYYQLTQPYAWSVLPGAGLLLGGTVIIILWFLQRGLGNLVESLEGKEAKKK